MRAVAVVCPFAQFGSPGAQTGAELVADALRELIADNRRETRPIRGHAYELRLREIPLQTPADAARWDRRARAAVRRALEAGDFLVYVGGNHLSTRPVYEELGRAGSSLVVQCDAHLDVYDLHDTHAELSHGNFIRHLKRRPRIVHLGHRDLFLPAAEIERYFVSAYSAADLAIDGTAARDTIRAEASSADRVFLDLDCDVLDPSVFPAVAQPVPFGWSGDQMLRWVEAVVGRNFAGVIVSEFDPGRDTNDRCLAAVVWWIEYCLLRRAESCGRTAG